MTETRPEAKEAPAHGFDPAAVETWIFDLDNTLYPASCNLFAQVDQRMGLFIQDLLSLELTDARALQKRYFREHGTTLRGLMDRHDVAPKTFLDFVHDVDMSVVPPSPQLDAALTALDGRKLVFTNATVHYSERVLGRIGIGHHFEAIFDIIAADYRPKPDHGSYRELIDRHEIDPKRAVLVEDIARNLAPAAELGMTTVWIPNDAVWSSDGADQTHVHHVTDDLAGWLENLMSTRGSAGA